MGFFDTLQSTTRTEREQLFTAPIFSKTLSGAATLDDYIAFLSQAYHHVKHTVPLLMATGSRLPEKQEWLRTAVAEYIEEEIGHQEWILNDIAVCGYDKETIRTSQPARATELMIAYAYDRIQRGNPIGFFGMVHVLEGTSISTADNVASSLKQSLSLPESAFSYLRSHGALDQQHVKFFAELMDQVIDPDDQAQIIHCARMFYYLYGEIFRSLEARYESVRE